MNIIIVDDEELIRRGLEKILKQMNLGVEIVGSYGNGMDAWAHIAKLGDGELDAVITDIKMPVMDGLRLVEHLRGRSIPTVVLSGFGEFEYARSALRSGVVLDYLLKPVDKSALQEVLHKLKLSRGGAEGEDGGPGLAEESGHPVVEQIKAMLEREYDKPFDMERISESAGMSANYLSRLFKQETGETMTDYLIGIRLNKARQFMSDHPSLKNYEIAQLVGYSDPVYFNKLFKKEVGVTPKEYRAGKLGSGRDD